MALLQLHYIPPTLGEPLNSSFREESALMAKVAEAIITLLVEECDLRVSENGQDLGLKLHIELVRKPRVEPVIIEQ